MIELSPETYHLIQQQAAVLNATAQSVVESAVHLQYGASGAPAAPSDESTIASNASSSDNNDDSLPSALEDELVQLTFLTDDELWLTAQTKLDDDLHERMEALLEKQRSSELNDDELAEADGLASRSERVMLIRAKSAALLKERGHDITSLGPAETSS